MKQARRPVSPALVLTVLAFGVFVAADDLTVVTTMLRQIVVDLEIALPEELDKAAWIVNAYLIGYVVVMPFIGRLSDLIGRRIIYIGAMVLFLAGSVWVPLAKDFDSFLLGRVLTAFGGGAMVPVSMAIIADIYPAKRRASALGILGAIDTAGWVWGPLYGAILIKYFTWQWQFYLNIPLSLIGIAAAWYALRDLPRPSQKSRIDWLGTTLLSVTLISLNMALLNSGDISSAGGFGALAPTAKPSTAPLFIAAAVTFALFLLLQRYLMRPAVAKKWRIAPLIDLSIFRRPNFSPAVLINFIIGAILIIAMVNVPLIINVLEFDVGEAAILSGKLLSAMTGAMAVSAWLGGKMAERLGYKLAVMPGLLLCAIGFGMMGRSWVAGSPYGMMAWQLGLLGVGFGVVIAPIGAAVINAAPPDQRGIASSLVIVMRLIGMSVGLSGLTAWGLERFNVLRDLIVLPEAGTAGYTNALIDGLTNTTVQVLTETFLISAAAAAVALLISLLLKKTSDE